MPSNEAWYGMNWIRQEKRLAVYIRDGFRCLYCDRDLRRAKPGEISLDHLICRSQGGTNDATNLVTACLSCNSGRCNRRWWVFATPAAAQRIKRVRRRKLNVQLAKSILLGEVADPRRTTAH